MKKITFLFTFLISFWGFSQQQQYLLGFEPSTPSGEIANWVSFENPNPTISIVTNPDPDGVNTSSVSKVMKVDFAQASACYAGLINGHGTLGTWRFDTAIPNNVTVSMQVNKSIAGKVGIKFVTPTNGTVIEVTTNEGLVSTLNEWVTLTWNISSLNTVEQASPRSNDQFVIFVDFTCGGTNRVSGGTLLIDNVTWNANKLTNPATCTDGIQNGIETGIDCGGNCAPCLGQAPLTAAPTPPARNAADVVSMYSNAYSNVTLTELPTGWSDLTTFTPIQIQGNDTWKVTGCQFLGMVTNYANGVDISAMETMHVDYWTPDAPGISVKIVNTVDGGEAIASLGTTVSGSWQSIDIPMSAFAAVNPNLNKTKITQLLIDPASPNILFIDNFYFYKTPSQAPITAAPTPPVRNAADVVSMYSNAYSNVTLTELPTGWSTLASFTPIQIQGNDTWKVTGCEFLGMVTNYATGVDISAMETMHVDYWTPDAPGISVKIVNTVDGGEAIASLGTTVSGSWQSIDVPMTAFATANPNLNKTKITQLLIDPVSPIILFIDNFYFYKTPLSSDSFTASKVKLYPNPTSNVLNIESVGTIQNIAIYNVLGQEVMNKLTNQTLVSLDVSGLNAGVYVIKTAIDGTVSSTKFIKE